MSDGGRGGGDGETMGDVSHVHPDTSETFGEVYRRGPAVADGGEAPARRGTVPEGSADADTDTDTDGGTDADTVADVDHAGPEPEANDVWSRGPEGGHMNDTGDDHDVTGGPNR